MSDVTVESPYVARCQHEIASCPKCGKPTTRQVRGQTLQKFLLDLGAVDADTAKEMWQMRQLMHGALPFDSSRLERLPEFTQRLRAAITPTLKDRLGMSNQPGPMFEPEATIIHPSMALGGRRQVTEADLLSLSPVGDQPAVGVGRSFSRPPLFYVLSVIDDLRMSTCAGSRPFASTEDEPPESMPRDREWDRQRFRGSPTQCRSQCPPRR